MDIPSEYCPISLKIQHALRALQPMTEKPLQTS
jgi:hypothetical protein